MVAAVDAAFYHYLQIDKCNYSADFCMYSYFVCLYVCVCVFVCILISLMALHFRRLPPLRSLSSIQHTFLDVWCVCDFFFALSLPSAATTPIQFANIASEHMHGHWACNNIETGIYCLLIGHIGQMSVSICVWDGSVCVCVLVCARCICMVCAC